MAIFHQFVQSAFYAFAQGLAMFSVYSWLVYGVALGVGAMSGALAARLARGYERALLAEVPIDVSTFLMAMRASMSRAGWAPQDVAGAMLMLGFTVLCLYARGPFDGMAAGLACAILFVLARVDMRTGLLPDALTLPLLGLGVWIGPQAAGEAVFAAALTYIFVRVPAALYERVRGRAGMGGGDFKLMAALAAWTGGTALLWIVLGACVLGLVFAMVAQCRFIPRGAYPFGPFLALAAAPVIVLGPAVQSWF